VVEQALVVLEIEFKSIVRFSAENGSYSRLRLNCPRRNGGLSSEQVIVGRSNQRCGSCVYFTESDSKRICCSSVMVTTK
jgi:hypothetical protein